MTVRRFASCLRGGRQSSSGNFSDASLARFQREAEVLAALNHPHIAQIHGLEKSGGLTALVMELVEGEDLSQRIANGAVPIDEAPPIAKQIAEALEAAHEQGISDASGLPGAMSQRAGLLCRLPTGTLSAVTREGRPEGRPSYRLLCYS